MVEGRRWSVDNPSPTMKSFTKYINEHEGEGFVSESQVAATFIHHRDWQAGHAQELVEERRIAKEQRWVWWSPSAKKLPEQKKKRKRPTKRQRRYGRGRAEEEGQGSRQGSQGS